MDLAIPIQQQKTQWPLKCARRPLFCIARIYLEYDTQNE